MKQYFKFFLLTAAFTHYDIQTKPKIKKIKLKVEQDHPLLQQYQENQWTATQDYLHMLALAGNNEKAIDAAAREYQQMLDTLDVHYPREVKEQAEKQHEKMLAEQAKSHLWQQEYKNLQNQFRNQLGAYWQAEKLLVHATYNNYRSLTPQEHKLRTAAYHQAWNALSLQFAEPLKEFTQAQRELSQKIWNE